MRKKALSVLLAATMAVGLLTGCGGNEQTQMTDTETNTEISQTTEADNAETVQSDGTFTMAISYMPNSLLPSTASDDYTTMVRPIYEPLFAETKNGLEYYLADSLEISADGLVYTLKLNQEATWSDGEPVVVDDILFSMEYSGLNYGGKTSYNTVNGQEVTFNKIDDKTLEITLPEVYNIYSMTLARMFPLPSHAFDNDPSKVADSGYFNSTDMVTSGAYVVSEINDDSIVYTARDDYYRGTPSVKKIVLKTIGSGSSRQVAFENGEISYMRITTAEELEKYSSQPENYTVSSISEARLNYLQINPYGPANLTEEQREAIFLALNPQEIIDIAYGSDEIATVANAYLTPDQSYYNADFEGYSQNLERAKELADSTGLTGKTLVYVYNADRANMEAVATVVQQQLAQIGVNLSIEGLDSTTFFSRFFAAMYGNGQETTWDFGSNGWDSERGMHLAQSYSYFNSKYDAWGFSQKVKDLAVAVNTATTQEEAAKLADELQQQAQSEYWEYPLTYTNYIMVSQKNVTGLENTTLVPEFIDWLKIQVD